MKKMSKDEITAAKMKLYAVMLQHVGPDKKIGMGELFETVFDRPWHHRINDTKALRKLITDMRRDGMPVVSSSSTTNGGYWVSASGSEINAYCEQARRRALSILGRVAAIRRVSLPEYLGQMALEMEAGNVDTAQ
jgi:hypothetical protein